MGLDLTLLPFDCDQPMLSFSHSLLGCMRRENLFELISRLSSQPVPENFTSYLSRDNDDQLQYFALPNGVRKTLAANLGPHYGRTLKTPYGQPLMWVRAKDLLTCAEHKDVRDNPKNRAVWAYLAQLDSETKIALYWH